jgi:thymidine kinase
MRRRYGRLSVITGCMFSGKSTEFLLRMRRAEASGKRVRYFHYGPEAPPSLRGMQDTQTHSGISYPTVFVHSIEELENMLDGGEELIGIDEAQFLPRDAALTCVEHWISLGKDVVLSGLDLDYAGRPYGPMPIFLALADDIVKLRAVCARCGADATRTQRMYGGRPAPARDPLYVRGGPDRYEPRCRDCYIPPTL